MTKEFDVVILGSGPAGLQAAIHASRAKTDVLVMGRKHKSSIHRAHVENYCCLGSITGDKLLAQGADQALTAGAQFLDEDVIKILPIDTGFTIKTESNQSIFSRTLILAMGVSRNKLGLAGEKKLIGKGVSYCVDCDANFYTGVPVAIVGNESAAVAGALTLLFYASEVHLLSEKLEVTETLAHQVETSDVQLHMGRKIKQIIGEAALEGVLLDNDKRLDVKGLFIETGAKGAVELASFLGVALDDEKFKYIVVDKEQKTNIPGVFAAGDICGPPWQIAKAVGEGCVAGLSAAKMAKKRR